MKIIKNICCFFQLQEFHFQVNSSFRILSVFLMVGALSSLYAQDDKEKQKELKESQQLLGSANSIMQEGNFPLAEAKYREAIALNPEEDVGKYNLGTVYYDKAMNATALNRFKQAAAVADSKEDKHKAFHNLGNTFMNEKKYQEAVESYKNALRNNPEDEETRYNLALAKEFLEDQQQNGEGDDNKEDQEDKKEEQEQEQENENNKKDGEDGDKENEEDQGDEKEDKEEGDNEEEKGKPDEPDNKEEENKQPPPPQPGQLSPQQVKNLLEAMNNEEKKVQDKVNAKKEKGTKTKSEKDW